ncbi:MAG: hypothetical protein IKT29_01395 [Flavobacteriales bacterium]|nr:hypothetical protein [Flavobacteriales bacterium]
MSTKICPTHTYRSVFYGAAASVIFSILSTGWYHPDEHYQIMEYANLLLTGSSQPQNLPWEYLKEMRSCFLPSIVYIIGRSMQHIDIYNPFILATIMRVIACLLSITSILILFKAIKPRLKDRHWERYYIWVAFFFWGLIYLHARFSSENISGSIIIICVSYYIIWSRYKKINVWQAIALGVMAGLAFVVRYQMCIALLAILLYVIIIDKRYKESIIATLSALGIIGLGVIIDRLFYGHWTFTPYNYFYENIVVGHASYFGEYGILRYIYEILREGMFIFPAIILCSWIYYIWKNPKDIITWVTTSYILAHFFISHKEPRFLFPMIGFCPYFIIYTLQSLPHHILKGERFIYSARVIIVINTAAILYLFFKGDRVIDYYHTIYNICQKEKDDVYIINASDDSFAYHYHEDILYPREVSCHFYLHRGVSRIHAQDINEANKIAKNYRHTGKTVLILSNEPNLSVNLPFKKILYSPYPRWVVEYFNINDWVSRSSGTNEYIYQIKKDITYE